MPILGTVASQVPANLPTTSFFSIATSTVSSGGTSAISFSSIPSTYKHLQVRAFARGTATGNADYRESLRMRVNGDTGSNYTLHRLWGDGVAVTGVNVAGKTEYETAGMVQDGDGLANAFGYAVVEILDYASTNKYKTFRSLTGFDNNTTGTSQKQGGILLTSCVWMNTNAISSLTMYCSANIAQYSHFALYGIKG
jgi:hypothetical protein